MDSSFWSDNVLWANVFPSRLTSLVSVGGRWWGWSGARAMWPSHKAAGLGDEERRTVIEKWCQRQRRLTLPAHYEVDLGGFEWAWREETRIEWGRQPSWTLPANKEGLGQIDQLSGVELEREGSQTWKGLGNNWSITWLGWTESFHYCKTLCSFLMKLLSWGE